MGKIALVPYTIRTDSCLHDQSGGPWSIESNACLGPLTEVL